LKNNPNVYKAAAVTGRNLQKRGKQAGDKVVKVMLVFMAGKVKKKLHTDI